jgi:hypothetical protein
MESIFGKNQQEFIMKRSLKRVGILFLCMALQQMQAIESCSADTEQYQLAEKGCKSESKSKIRVGDGSRHHSTTCLKGATGATGATGAQGKPFTPVYAMAFQESSKNFGTASPGDILLLPFSTLESAQGITLNSTTDTFTLPKGVFTVQFQFITDDKRVLFDPVYLKIGGSDLTLARISVVYDPDSTLSSFSGSTIFQVCENDTQVQLYAKVLAIASGTPQDLVITDPNTDQNYPVRIVFQKIGEVC